MRPKKPRDSERSDRRGGRGILSPCPTGAVTQWLGVGIWVTKEGDAIFAPPSFVVPVGHDPTTPWLWVRCSNQLSYGTGCRPTRFDGRHVKVTKLFEKDKTLWISLQNLRQHVFVKCKKITCITLNLQYIDVQGDSMYSNLSIHATCFFQHYFTLTYSGNNV